MLFEPCPVSGAWIISAEPRVDPRGSFARMWCAGELADRGLVTALAQINTAQSHRAGTLRGMHFQRTPHAEVKVVRCNRGAVFDVVLDLRPDSASHLKWFGIELSATDGRMLYIPEGCAHGYQTLTDDTELMYLTSMPYVPGAATGVRYDDPAFGIDWPRDVSVISEQDAGWPDFAPGSI